MLTPFAVIGRKENISRERVRAIIARDLGKDLPGFIKRLRKQANKSKYKIIKEDRLKKAQALKKVAESVGSAIRRLSDN